MDDTTVIAPTEKEITDVLSRIKNISTEVGFNCFITVDRTKLLPDYFHRIQVISTKEDLIYLGMPKGNRKNIGNKYVKTTKLQNRASPAVFTTIYLTYSEMLRRAKDQDALRYLTSS